MKKGIFLAATLLTLLPGSVLAQANKPAEKNDTVKFTVIKEAPITSIKDQHRSGTCWDYSSLGFFESELLRQGKGTFDLCESFVAYHTYMDRAEKAIRMHGDVSFAQGGSFYDVLYCMKHYGICPQEAMPFPGSLYGDSLFNFNEFGKIMSSYVEGISKSDMKRLPPTWKKEFSSILANYFGELPATFQYKGKTYTPQSFQKSLGLDLDDYVSLASFSHHPFYSKFIIEVQDNWRWGQSYNLPIDEFMQVFDNAINNGYPIAWGSDVSEQGFTRDGVAVMPDTEKVQELSGSDMAHWLKMKPEEKKLNTKPQPQKWCTQEERQEAYDNWETTDDHGMLIYGIAKDQEGNDYYMVKNSWGKAGKYDGLWYASKAFVRYKTMNIVVNKNALPKEIAKKLGIK